MPAHPKRTDLLHDLPEQPVIKLGFTTFTGQPDGLGRLDVAADRLTVHLRELRDRAVALAPQPQPQDLRDLEHPDLPVCHDPDVAAGKAICAGGDIVCKPYAHSLTG